MNEGIQSAAYSPQKRICDISLGREDPSLRNRVQNVNCEDWNPAQIKKHHYNKYGASHLNFFDVYRAYWIAMEMKIAIVVANCCKDSKVAVDYNTGWN